MTENLYVPQITAMSLLNLAGEMSRGRRSGYSFVMTVAVAVAHRGVGYAYGFMRGAWYSGITSRGHIGAEDFREAVNAFGATWDEFVSASY